MTTQDLQALKDEALQRLQAVLNAREPALRRDPAILGQNDEQGSATVDNWPRYCWVRIGSDSNPVKVFNVRTPHTNGLSVVVGYDPAQPELFQVLSERGAIYPPDDDNPSQTVKHASQHEWGNPQGFDVGYFQPRQLRGCRPYATSPYTLFVGIDGGIFEIGDTLYKWPGSASEGLLDLTTHVPSSGMRWVLVTMDATVPDTGPVITAGDSKSLVALADIPKSPDPSDWRVAAFLLKAGDTAISDWPDEERIVDLRFTGSRSASSSGGYVDFGNCIVVSLTGGNFDSIQLGLNAATPQTQVVILNNNWAENVVTPGHFLTVAGLMDQHYTGEFGTRLVGADDVGPILTIDDNTLWGRCMINRALSGGSGDFVGLDASDLVAYKHLSDMQVRIEGGVTGRDVYALKTGAPAGHAFTASRSLFVVNDAGSGAAVECVGGDAVFDNMCELRSEDSGGTALIISGDGVYQFEHARIEGGVKVTGAAEVLFRNCRITGDVDIAGGGATVYGRSCWVGGNITHGAGDKFVVWAVNQRAGKTITGSGTVVSRWMILDETVHTDHFFGPVSVNQAAYMRLQPSGAVSGLHPSGYGAFWTDYLANSTNYKAIEMTAGRDGVNPDWGMIRTIAGGTETAPVLKLGVGPAIANYVQLNDAGDIIMPAGALVDGHDIDEMTVASNGPSGFPNRADSVLSWVVGTRTLTITPASGSFDIWQAGFKFTISSGDSVVVTDVTGVHLIYYDAGSLAQVVNPSHAQVDDVIVNKVLVALVYWNANTDEAPIVADERHGCVMSGKTHEYLHDTRGAVYSEGLTLNDYIVDVDSDAALTFQVTDGEIYDEDLPVEIKDGAAANHYEQQLSGADAQVPVLYRDDISGGWIEDAATTLPYKTAGSGRLAYNNDDGDGTFSQIEITNNRFMSVTLVATNDWQFPIKMIQGQNEYTTMATAVDDALNEILALGSLPTPEIVLLYRLVLQTGSSYGGTKKAKIVAVADFRSSLIFGLPTDDGSQYLLLDGSRAMTGDLDMGTHNIVSPGTVDGVDVAGHVLMANVHHGKFDSADHSALGDTSPHHARYTDGEALAAVPDATTSVVGKTRLATTGETQAGSLATVANTPAGLRADGPVTPAASRLARLNASGDLLLPSGGDVLPDGYTDVEHGIEHRLAYTLGKGSLMSGVDRWNLERAGYPNKNANWETWARGLTSGNYRGSDDFLTDNVSPSGTAQWQTCLGATPYSTAVSDSQIYLQAKRATDGSATHAAIYCADSDTYSENTWARVIPYVRGKQVGGATGDYMFGLLRFNTGWLKGWGAFWVVTMASLGSGQVAQATLYFKSFSSGTAWNPAVTSNAAWTTSWTTRAYYVVPLLPILVHCRPTNTGNRFYWGFSWADSSLVYDNFYGSISSNSPYVVLFQSYTNGADRWGSRWDYVYSR